MRARVRGGKFKLPFSLDENADYDAAKAAYETVLAKQSGIAFTIDNNDHPEYGGLELSLRDFVGERKKIAAGM